MTLDRSTSPLLRTKTAAEWTSENPFLHRGDLGIESDTGKEKYGIGLKWADTSYSPAADDASVVRSVTTGIAGADAITNIVSLTQAEYDAIAVKNATTLYIVTS